ncbi:MAG: hypothetical protein GF320_17660 [Armatimonadia bacterium]|nr:hypothetical protein [Armatimonadia bacterium]
MAEWIDVSGRRYRRPETLCAGIGVGLIGSSFGVLLVLARRVEPDMPPLGILALIGTAFLAMAILRGDQARASVSDEAIRLAVGRRRDTHLWSDVSGIALVAEPMALGQVDWWISSDGVLLIRDGVVDWPALAETQSTWWERLRPADETEPQTGGTGCIPAPPRWISTAAAFMTLVPAAAVPVAAAVTSVPIERFVATATTSCAAWFLGMLGLIVLTWHVTRPRASGHGLQATQGAPTVPWERLSRPVAVELGPKCEVPLAWLPDGELPLLVRAGRTMRMIEKAWPPHAGTDHGEVRRPSPTRAILTNIGGALGIGSGGAMVIAVGVGAAGAPPWSWIASLLPAGFLLTALALVALGARDDMDR